MDVAHALPALAVLLHLFWVGMRVASRSWSSHFQKFGFLRVLRRILIGPVRFRDLHDQTKSFRTNEFLCGNLFVLPINIMNLNRLAIDGSLSNLLPSQVLKAKDIGYQAGN
jgi:hypothetical protein